MDRLSIVDVQPFYPNVQRVMEVEPGNVHYRIVEYPNFGLSAWRPDMPERVAVTMHDIELDTVYRVRDIAFRGAVHNGTFYFSRLR